MSAKEMVLIRPSFAADDGASPDSSGHLVPFEVIFEVRGEADIASATGLRQELAWALSVAGPRLVFDVSGLTFCALAGLDALVAAENGALAQGRSVRWSGESRLLARMRSTWPAGVGRVPLTTSAERAPEQADRCITRGIVDVATA